MSKKEQVLLIEPPIELTFTGPFTQAVSSYMKLKNPSDRKVCFKIKTTAPKRYCVKPNSGVVDPNTEVQIAVSLQPFEYDPAEKNKHKFMVQSMFAPDGEINQDTLWKEIDQNDLMDSKLRCVFAMPQGQEPSNSIEEVKFENKYEAKSPSVAAPAPVTAKAEDQGQMTAAVGEIKKLNEQLSQLRQENIVLKEETLRLKRIAAASDKPHDTPSYSSTTVTALGPQSEVLPTTHIYAALIILVLGVMLGKFFLWGLLRNNSYVCTIHWNIIFCWNSDICRQQTTNDFKSCSLPGGGQLLFITN